MCLATRFTAQWCGVVGCPEAGFKKSDVLTGYCLDGTCSRCGRWCWLEVVVLSFSFGTWVFALFDMIMFVDVAYCPSA